MEGSRPAQTPLPRFPPPQPLSTARTTTATRHVPYPPSNAARTNSVPPQRETPTSNIRKRALDGTTARLQDSGCYKIRAVLRDLRPHVIEVLRTPDFRSCKAANEIRENVKLLLDIYSQITADTASMGKCKNTATGQPSPPVVSQKASEKHHHHHHQDVTPTRQPQPTPAFAKPPEEKPIIPSVHVSEKLQFDEARTKRTYIVGGSAFGWNFITYPGNKAVYYGVTKEAKTAAKSSVFPPLR